MKSSLRFLDFRSLFPKQPFTFLGRSNLYTVKYIWQSCLPLKCIDSPYIVSAMEMLPTVYVLLLFTCDIVPVLNDSEVKKDKVDSKGVYTG